MRPAFLDSVTEREDVAWRDLRKLLRTERRNDVLVDVSFDVARILVGLRDDLGEPEVCE